jgi:hypothetical protein
MEEGIEFEETKQSSSQDSHEIWLANVCSMLRDAFYAAFYKLHKKTGDQLTSNNFSRTRLRLVVLVALQALQAYTFMILGRSELSHYSGFELGWEVLGFTRPDVLFAYLGALDSFLYLSFVLLGLQVLWLAVSIAESIRDTGKELRLMTYAASFVLSATCDWMLLPTLSILLAEIKGASPVTQILDGQLNSAPWRQSIAGWLVGVLILMAVSNKLFSSEVRHDFTNFDFRARSTAKFDLLYRMMIVSPVICSYAIDEWPMLQYFFIFGLAMISASCFVVWQPYFNTKANFIYVMSSVAMAWWSVSFILAFSLNIAEVSVALAVFITPLLFVTVHAVVEKRATQVASMALELLDTESMLNCELGLRTLIFNQAPDILETFNNLKLKKSLASQKMLYVWETHFCLGILENDRLARIKFAGRIQVASGGLEADFHEFALSQEFSLSEFIHEDIAFLRFQSMLETAKRTDEQICNLLYQYWTNFQGLSISRIARRIKSVHDKLKLLHSQYSMLLKEFPRSSTVKELYGSFLNDIGNNQAKGTDLLFEAEVERRNLKECKSNNLSFFDDVNGVMVISGSASSLGMITYCNVEAAEILGYSVGMLKGSQVDIIIPPPFTAAHHKHMRSFLGNCSNTDLGHAATLLFLKKNKFLVECYSLLKCSVLLSHPCFILLLKQKTSSKQVAILNSEGTIECHTELFPMFVGSLDTSISDIFIEQFISNYGWAQDNMRNFCPFLVKDVNRYAMIGLLKIGREKARVVFVFNNSEEAEHWSSNNMYEETTNYTGTIDGRILHHSEIEVSPMPSMLSVPQVKGVTFSEGNQVFSMSSMRESQFIASSMNATSLSKVRSNSAIVEQRNSLFKSTEVIEVQEIDKPQRESSTVNSSFSNNSTFTQSVLGKLLIERVRKAVRVFEVSYFVMVSVIVMTSTFTAVYFNLTVNSLANSISANDLGAAMHDVILLADSSRKMQLTTDQSDIRALLEGDITKAISHLEALHKDLNTKSLTLPEGKLKEQLTTEWVLVWEQLNHSFISNKRNLLDTLQLFIDHVSSSQARNFVDTYNSTAISPHSFFLHRNGLGESLHALNATLLGFREQAEGSVNALLTGTFICMAVVGGVFACCLIITLPKILHIQSRASAVWNTMFAVPMGTLVDLRRKARDRLQVYHSEEIELEEERSYSLKQKRTGLKDPVWRTLIGLMLLFAGLTSVFYWYIYANAVTVTTQLLLERPHKAELIYAHKSSLLLALCWATEVNGQSAEAMYSLEPEARYTTSPQLAFLSAYDNARQARHFFRVSLMSGDLPMNSATELVMFDTVGSEVGILHRGLMAAEFNYLELLMASTQADFSEDFSSLVTLERSIQTVIDDSSSEIVSEIDDAIIGLGAYTIWLFVLYEVVSICFLACVIMPVLRRVNYRIKQVWQLTSLIPNEVMQSVLEPL